MLKSIVSIGLISFAAIAFVSITRRLPQSLIIGSLPLFYIWLLIIDSSVGKDTRFTYMSVAILTLLALMIMNETVIGRAFTTYLCER
jgi:hypothetical protein